jgi:RAB protein geranylgeranyltransferase component A
VEEIKLQLLAKSSICPGIITIIWSLITSNATTEESEKFDSPEEELRAINEKMKIQKEVVREQMRIKFKIDDHFSKANHQDSHPSANNQGGGGPQQ